MTRPFRLLTHLAVLTVLSLGLVGCGGSGPAIDEEIDAGGYAPGEDDVIAEPVLGVEDSGSEPVPVDPGPAPIDSAEPTP